DPLQVERLRGGVDIGDGRPPAAAKVRRLGPRKLEIVIGEGRKRQVRRMVEAVGNRVEVLKRTSVGPLRLERLRPGGWRDLTRGEIESLERCAGAIASGKNE
nr:pseudouridine synthase [bacterium]